MRVKVTHSIEIDDVPKRIKHMLEEIKSDVDQILNNITAASRLSDSPEYLGPVATILDNSRQTLTNIDVLMGECHSISLSLKQYFEEQATPAPPPPPPPEEQSESPEEMIDVREG